MNSIRRTSCISDLVDERRRLEKVVKSYDAQIRAYKNFRAKADKELTNIKAALECLSETGDEI